MRKNGQYWWVLFAFASFACSASDDIGDGDLAGTGGAAPVSTMTGNSAGAGAPGVGGRNTASGIGGAAGGNLSQAGAGGVVNAQAGASAGGSVGGNAPQGGASAGGSAGGNAPQGGASAGGSAGGNAPQGGASAGGSAGGNAPQAGAPASGGAAACQPRVDCKPAPLAGTGDLQQDCVDRVNQFRVGCWCLPALERWTEAEACADQHAEYDAQKNQAHAGFKDKICANSGSAQNECPGYRSESQVIEGCLQQMYNEGPPPSDPCTGDCFQKHGHFINMTNPKQTKVACGFFTTGDGKVWAVQNFR